MNRFLITTTAVLLASVASMVSAAKPANAGSLEVSIRMGAKDLFPKTTKRLRGYKSQMARLERAHGRAHQKGDRGLMQRIADRHSAIKTKAQRAYAKLQRVRGITTVTIHGDARRGLNRAEIAKFLRGKRSWQGTSVHFYNRNGKAKAGRTIPKTFDGKRSNPARSSGTGGARRPMPNPSNTPLFPLAPPPRSGGTSLFGTGR